MCVAIFTDPKEDSFFDGEERDEEEAQIMIHSFLADFGMATDWTDSRLSLENCGFWLNTTYKKEHFSALRRNITVILRSIGSLLQMRLSTSHL